MRTRPIPQTKPVRTGHGRGQTRAMARGNTVMSRFVGRANVAKRLAPLEGLPGRSVYADGAARFETATETLLVRPPFPLRHEARYPSVHVQPLLDSIAQNHVVGAVLVRLGGYAVGVF